MIHRAIQQASALAFATLLVSATLLPAVGLAAESSWQLDSPDGRNAIAVHLSNAGILAFDVQRDGQTAVARSPLGLRCQAGDFTSGLEISTAPPIEQRRQRYELLSGPVPHVDSLLVQRSLHWRNPSGAELILDLAASNQGVAFRYRLPGPEGNESTILEEATGFRLPTRTRCWMMPYHEAGEYTPAYEDFFFEVAPGTPPPVSRDEPRGWSMPALFHVADGPWALLMESGTDGSYCGCHLVSDDAGLYRIAFARSDETTRGAELPPGSEPTSVLPWTLPWRVVVLGTGPGDILLSTLATDLAPACRIEDTGWIKPGRASWSWWSTPDGPNTAELFDRFTDVAADFGWEYTLFDAGWWDPGLKGICDYAHGKGVLPMAWTHANDFYDRRRRQAKLAEFAHAGAVGAKIDFWCSDRQETMAAIQATLDEAAQLRMAIVLHGCTVPRGWQRTWPNLLSCEAVLGSETYMFDEGFTEGAARLNTILPFTRNVAGPMDYTPFALSPKKYARTTTAAHELATLIVFSSAVVHIAESAAVLETLPDAVKTVLRDAPANWDETRFVAGSPGHSVILARRSGERWFVAGLNGQELPLEVEIRLDSFGQFTRCTAITEGTEPANGFRAESLPAGGRWNSKVPPRGGFVLRLEP